MKTEFLIFLEENGLRQKFEHEVLLKRGQSLYEYLDVFKNPEYYLDGAFTFKGDCDIKFWSGVNDMWLKRLSQIRSIIMLKKAAWMIFLILFITGMIYQIILRNIW